MALPDVEAAATLVMALVLTVVPELPVLPVEPVALLEPPFSADTSACMKF